MFLYAGLWGLVNNAGVAGRFFGPSDWITVKDYDEVMSVNFHGLVNMTNTFLPLLKKQKGSRVVNMSSIAGRMISTMAMPYNSSKFAVEAYSDILRYVLGILDSVSQRSRINSSAFH